MNVCYPVSTSLITEARLYANDSIQHTMDYHGWSDQHQKQERITYGKFGQLWVAEFCKLNGIDHKKDRSSPKVADDLDLLIRGRKIDVKTTVSNSFVGQVSPGVIDKECDDYCFLITDKQCSYVKPIGFVSKGDYIEHANCVEEGDIMPGTSVRQRFSRSYFLPADSIVLQPFVQYLFKGPLNNKKPFPVVLVDASEMMDCNQRISAIERLLIEQQSMFVEQHLLLMEHKRLLAILTESSVNNKQQRKCSVTNINRSPQFDFDKAVNK